MTGRQVLRGIFWIWSVIYAALVLALLFGVVVVFAALVGFMLLAGPTS